MRFHLLGSLISVMQRVFLLLLVCAVTCAITSATSDSDYMLRPLQSIEDYPVGDPRRCLEVARRNRFKMAVITHNLPAVCCD